VLVGLGLVGDIGFFNPCFDLFMEFLNLFTLSLAYALRLSSIGLGDLSDLKDQSCSQFG